MIHDIEGEDKCSDTESGKSGPADGPQMPDLDLKIAATKDSEQNRTDVDVDGEP